MEELQDSMRSEFDPDVKLDYSSEKEHDLMSEDGESEDSEADDSDVEEDPDVLEAIAKLKKTSKVFEDRFRIVKRIGEGAIT
jgi:hypothetical protein